MTRQQHDQQRALVQASEHADRHPDVYRRRFPSRETAEAAVRVNDALARLESGGEDAREEFIRARVELRERVRADRRAWERERGA